jgi:hypothetical protein
MIFFLKFALNKTAPHIVRKQEINEKATVYLEVEPKLNCLLEPEPKLQIAAPAPFFFIKDLKKFYRKNHSC